MFPHNHSQYYVNSFQQESNFYDNHDASTAATATNQKYYDYNNQQVFDESKYDFPKTGIYGNMLSILIGGF